MAPPVPGQKDDVLFYVTFLNTGGEQKFRWFVFIYKEGQANPFGQTSSDHERILPPGIAELLTVNTWRPGIGQPCTNFVAKVNWVESGGGKSVFKNIDGQEYVLPFTICP